MSSQNARAKVASLLNLSHVAPPRCMPNIGGGGGTLFSYQLMIARRTSENVIELYPEYGRRTTTIHINWTKAVLADYGFVATGERNGDYAIYRRGN